MRRIGYFYQYYRQVEQCCFALWKWRNRALRYANSPWLRGASYGLLLVIFLAPFFASPTKRARKPLHPIGRSQVTVRRTVPQAELSAKAAADVPSESPENRLQLPTHRTVRLARLDIQDDVTICGENGNRAVVMLPLGGITLERENATFENIDFVAPTLDEGETQAFALIRITAQLATFRNCTFRSHDAIQPVTAIEWEPSDSADAACSRRLRVEGCSFSQLRQGIRLSGSGTWDLVFANSSANELETLIQCDPFPTGADVGHIELTAANIKNTQCALQLAAADWRQAGRLQIVANDSQFSVTPLGSLLRIEKGVDLSATLNHFEWTGHDSLCAADSEIALAILPDAETEPIDSEMLDMGGLRYGCIDERAEAELTQIPGTDASISKIEDDCGESQ